MSQRTKSNRKSPLRNRRNSNNWHNASSKRHKKREDANAEQECCDGCKCELDADTIDFYKEYMMDNVYSTSPYRLRNFHFAIDLVLFAIGALYVVLAPFTKVEESFNMQATHDMLFHGYLNLESYDHQQFPGVVPRSFIGSLLLSLMVYPWKVITIFILPFFLPVSGGIHLQQQCQYLIRFAMLFLNITALSKFRQSFVFSHFVQRADIYRASNPPIKGNVVQNYSHQRHERICMIQRFSVLFTVLIAAQFHFLFYCSRLLPNCFALPLVTIAFAEYFRNNFCRAVVCLAASTIWFRCDTIVIAVPFILIMLIEGYNRYSSQFCSFFKLFIIYGVAGSVGCISITLLVDSWFWNGFNGLKWPELEVLLFNTVDNQSSKWGVSPWRYYFWPLIPKMLLINVVFMIFSIFKIYPMIFVHELINRCTSPSYSEHHDGADNDHIAERSERRGRSDPMPLWKVLYSIIDWDSVRLMTICFVFVFLYSFLPHKECRFIFFIIPPCTLLSTIGCIRLLTLWGYRAFAHSQHTMAWFKQNLLERQRLLYFVWIPNELLLASLVKKLVSLDSPSTFSALRKYGKLILKEIPTDIGAKVSANLKAMASRIDEGAFCQCLTHFALPLLIVTGIGLSVVISWYGVYEASYNYPGGVAITVFPDIVRDFKNNMTRYHNGYFAQVNGQYYYNDHEEILHHDAFQRPNRTHSRSSALDDGANGHHNMHRRSKKEVSSSSTRSRAKKEGKSKGKVRKTKHHEMDRRHSEFFELYDAVNCVHIGNLAAISGVTRFMTPSFDREYRFSKTEQLSMDSLSAMEDPCNLYQEMYSKLCPESMMEPRGTAPIADQWDDDIYDEEYFERHDDYLADSEPLVEDECQAQITRRYPAILGFDYLISEHVDVPGFHLLPRGIIYAKSDSASTFWNMVHYFTSFIVSRSDSDSFLEPKLFVLARTTEFDEI